MDIAILQKYKVGEGEVEFDGRMVRFIVTAADMPEKENGIDLQQHCGYWGEGGLFVSEAIPVEYRPFVAWHELREYTQLGGTASLGACRQASHDEWEMVPEEMRPEYATFRYGQFRRLVELFGQGGSEFALNLRQSARFWYCQAANA